jgi:GNAT superfamily N-acetyltransferase
MAIMENPGRFNELRHRAIASARGEIEAFGSAAEDSVVLRRHQLVASVSPGTPERSFFNGVFYEDAAVLAGELDMIETIYVANGVTAWAVWVPDHDRRSAQLLAARGYFLDTTSRVMVIELDNLPGTPSMPPGIETQSGDAAAAMGVNDRAYGQQTGWFRAAADIEQPIDWRIAYCAGEPVGCVGTIRIGPECCLTGIATLPSHQGRGIASHLLHEALVAARENGVLTASLRASKAGVPVYESFGFIDCGFVEMWEWRARPAAD